jgi:hypothetical protein
MTPQQVTEEVKDSNLRGRGGAGFPTGLKWTFTPMGPDAPRPKYLVANADEMEPGTFKDRLLLEGDPHQLIEGMILAGYANQADVAYVFVRGEYVIAGRRLQKAVAEAYSANYLGPNILGSDYGLELYVHMSGGRYMCGEETGLLNALEGKRDTQLMLLTRHRPFLRKRINPVAGCTHSLERADVLDYACFLVVSLFHKERIVLDRRRFAGRLCERRGARNEKREQYHQRHRVPSCSGGAMTF